jgi:uncharacterized protein YhbP (UPF0306 family)
MADVKDLVKQNIHGDSELMQLATVDGDQPWACTVHFVADDESNLYWLSLPTRRHSQEVAKHGKVAAAIVVKPSMPVIGVQVEGDAEEISDKETVAAVMKRYVAKYNKGQKFYDNFVAGKNEHRLYKLTPHLFVLFDEVNFPDSGRQEWRP